MFFVSGDEKADWWYRSDNQPLHPRYELVDEFRRESEGHSFHIVRFSRLLGLFGASAKVVEEVRQEEAEAVPLAFSNPPSSGAEQAVASWLRGLGYELHETTADAGFKWLALGPGDSSLIVEVMYVRGGSSSLIPLPERLQRIDTLARSLSQPLTLVVVASAPDVCAHVARVYARMTLAFRLATGILTPEGEFRVVRDLRPYLTPSP